MDSTWQALISNLAIVALTTSIWSQLHGWLEQQSIAVRKAATGILIGCGAVVSMLMSVQITPGVFFDLRSSLIAAGAFFGGPVVAGVSLVIAGSYRLHQGGAGAFIGLSNLVLSAVGALMLRRLGGLVQKQVYVVLLLSVWVAGLVNSPAFCRHLRG